MIKKTSQKKIIIIGAGIAGLAACTRLLEHGFDAIILEARNRYGGRIWTDNSLGISLGRGASFIHGAEDNPITQLVKNAHAKMGVLDLHKFITFDRNGIPIPYENVQKFREKFQILLKKAKELALSSKHDISLSSALSPFVDHEIFSPLERDLFQTRLLAFEGYMGANYESLSARHWDQEEAWPGKDYFLTSSYQPILDYLAKDCSIQLNTIVRKINTRTNDIELITEKAVFYADAVIITVPLGVLKKNDVIFNPPLPNYKQKAIQRLGMGLFNVTAIKFPTPFWPSESHAMFFSQFDTLSIPVFFNLQHFIKQPILMGFSGGKRARQLENFNDEELIEKTMRNLKKVFGAQLPEPESYLNTRWSQDPFTYGSYSYIPTGASGSDYDAIAKPISDRLFFAGEATSAKYLATTHGAYLSGIREAERIKNLYLN
ncbi:MAG: FAD-dependent oxidoreductase [Gammaproteobacteria bacterium]